MNWIEANFFIPETRNDPYLNGRIGLQPYQRDALNEALTPDENGNFKYSIIVWSDIKKSAKSTIAAAVNLYRATFSEFGEFYVIANDLKQADSRVAHYIRRAIELNPKMRKKYKQLGYRTTTPSGSYIEAIPIDPSGEAGTNADMITFSELWGAHEEDKNKMWAEMTLSPTKRGKSFRFIESYAGFMEESDLLYSLYELGVKQGELLWPNRVYNVTDSVATPLELYVNRSAGMLCLWNTQPRCPWQTKEYYCLPLPKDKNKLLVLTEHGWKPAVDIVLDDKLCTRGKEGVIQYQNPTNVFRDEYKGTLLRLKHNKCNLVMTPEHKIFGAFASHTRKVKSILERPFVYEYKEAKDAIKNQIGWIPGHGNWAHKPLDIVEVEDEKYDATLFVKLLAWYLSEGCIGEDKRTPGKIHINRATICQDVVANPDKYEEIKQLCLDLNINITLSHNGINIYNSKLAGYFHKFGRSHEKRIPRFVLENCSQDQIKGFVDAYIRGGGTIIRNTNGKQRDGSYLIYTNSDGMMLDLMEASFKVGYRPRHLGSYSSAPEKGRRPIHHIAISKTHLGWSGGNRRKHWTEEVAKDGTEVWCPTTPNGNFYVMQDGVCWWSGNSSEEKILPPGQFARLHRNQWVSNSETFIPMPWWFACYRKPEEWPVIDNSRQAMVLAMDAATSNDNFGLWLGCRHPQRPDEILTIYAKKWAPDHSGKIDFQGTEERPGPERVLRDLIKRYNIVQVAFDPYQLWDLSMRLKQEGLAWFRAFNQGSDRLLADSQFRDLIRDRRFWHRGEPDLTEHVQNANAKLDDQDSKVRIVKRVDRLKIDLAVAASMGSYTLLYLNL